jgi:hypothetical protein
MVADIILRLAMEVVGIPDLVTAAEVIRLRVTVVEAEAVRLRVTVVEAEAIRLRVTVVAEVIQPPAVAGRRTAEDRLLTEEVEADRTADMGGKP